MSNADMDSTKTETVAPKPHPITIGLAFVSPFLGVVATVIGIYSLFQNQRAVTLSRQAYLSVADPQLFLKRIPPQLSSVPVQNGESLVRVGYRFTLHNFGNTPATLDELTTHFYFPGGWAFKGEKNGKPAAIAPRLDFIVDTGTDAVLDTNALTAFDKQLAVIQRPDPESPMPFIRASSEESVGHRYAPMAAEARFAQLGDVCGLQLLLFVASCLLNQLLHP